MSSNIIDEYLGMSHQTEQELMAGGQAYGWAFIVDELVPEAIRQRKKIVWKDEPETGIDAMSYILEEL